MNRLLERHHRAGRVVLLLALFSSYLWLNRRADGMAPVDVAVALDRAIPFLPGWQFVYAVGYLFMLLPVAVVRRRRAFESVAWAYGWALAVSSAFFFFVPVRTVRPALAPTCFVEWGLAVNYHFDHPNNCFPSLHLSIAFLGALASGRANPRLLGPALFVATLIGASTLFVKQHYVADVLAGIFLAVVLDRWVMARGFRPAAAWGGSAAAGVGGRAACGPAAAEDAEGPAAYPAWVALTIPGAYGVAVMILGLLYGSGWRPWE
ncbi:MAG: phosphatase PAP2 family protein [Planctomycetes bacterium]|nr:phosphatase PAP2 family protein [Planctomycetota bacterium]